MPLEYIAIDSVQESKDAKGNPMQVVTDKGGRTWNVKGGLNGELAKKWHLLKPGNYLQLTIGIYKGKYEYVQDFALIEDVFKQKAIDEVQLKQRASRESSIEAQTATKAVTDLLVAEKVVPEDVKELYWKWIRKTLEAGSQ